MWCHQCNSKLHLAPYPRHAPPVRVLSASVNRRVRSVGPHRAGGTFVNHGPANAYRIPIASPRTSVRSKKSAVAR